jgi:ribonucleoside-diphosphate reductase alpha chain
MIEIKDRKLSVSRLWVPDHVEDVFSTVEWEKRTAAITNDKGDVIFEQHDVEVPKAWSQLAVNVVVSKYFYGKMGTDQRETSVKQLIYRVAHTITEWGCSDAMFDTHESQLNFEKELTHILVNQIAAFNSPVWFNVGLNAVYGHQAPTSGIFRWDDSPPGLDGEPDPGYSGAVACRDAYSYPQCSACFIQSVDDTIEDIMRLATSEAILFKHGSGTGTDLSTLRSTFETLSGGGIPSGPLSFMKIYDRVAGVIKSGGKTRRAAKMQSLGIWHPDIESFINAKWKEEQKAHILIDNGYDGSIDGEAYETAHFQNANFSVRVTDDYMRCLEQGEDWSTHGVRDGELKWTKSADHLWSDLADCAWHCGDPGVQFHTTINKWHTCKEDGDIKASNPCSEYMFLDDTACNLASINLMKFSGSDHFDVKSFIHTVNIMITAQEILVDHASYPTRDICQRSHTYRTLGLGYANLGAMLMSMGVPYDSNEGRTIAASITSLMTGSAYNMSQGLAGVLGSFEAYDRNIDSFRRVMQLHLTHALDNRDAASDCGSQVARYVSDTATSVWSGTCQRAKEGKGFRNAQVTVLAPTGTIGFMMDCDTTGVEPDIALVKYKALAGGGMLKLVNKSVEGALKHLKYTDGDIGQIITYIDDNDTIEGCQELRDEDLAVFDCAFKPMNGLRSICYMAHIQMMAAVQPFLSGAISKTVNMPEDSTPTEIAAVFFEGWKSGLKAVAIYRENSKRIQPLSVDKDKGEGREVKASAAPADVVTTLELALEHPDDYPNITKALTDYTQTVIRQVQAEQREKLPDTRSSITHKFEVQGHEGYINVGMYDDGRPGELFVTMNKVGSTVRGMMDGIGIAVSMCFQYGVPLQVLANKFEHTRFEPSGFTKNKDIPMAKSLLDYIFRWLSMSFPGSRYIGYTPQETVGLAVGNIEDIKVAEVVLPDPTQEPEEHNPGSFRNQDDAPPCSNCGSITVRNGSCYRCYNCGSSLGCS